MSAVMKMVLSLSLSGSVLILILFFCRPLFRDQLSRQWQYYIWLVVIARLVLPVAPEMGIVGTLFSDRVPTGQAVVQVPTDTGTVSEVSQVSAVKGDVRTQYQGSGRGGSRESAAGISMKDLGEKLLRNLWIVWIVTALLLLFRKITLYQGFVKYVRIGRGEVADIALLDRLSQIGERAGVRRPVELCVNSQVSSPLLIGFFRPCIVLPTTELQEEDFAYTVWHELTHYKRKDMFYKWLVQLAICLHWFNPLVWLMGHEINRACEFACDEAVVQTLGEEGRRAYGDTLFRAMGAGGTRRDFPVSVMLNESAELLKERLTAIMKFRKKSKVATTVSVVSVVALTMGATVMGAYVEPVRTAGIAHGGLIEPGEPAQTENAGNQNPANQNGGAGSDNQRIGDDNSLEDLAERYYESNMVLQFGAMFSAMDESAQRRWLDKVYADDDNSFFAAAVWRLDESSPLIGEYAEKAYADGAVSHFAILTGSLDSGSPLIETYAEKAYEDHAIDFFSILVDEMNPDVLRRWQDKAAAGDMDIHFQSVLLDSDDWEADKQRAEQEDAQQYQEWGITRDGDNFYYQNQPVRVFFDQYDGEQVVRTLTWNPAGTVDVKVTRSFRNKIISVEYMTGEEVAELFGTDGLPDWDAGEGGQGEDRDDSMSKKEKHGNGEEEFDPENDVYRLTQEELPDDVVRQMMDNGAVRKWYVYHSGGRQYLCYRGFAWSYGYQLSYDEEHGWQVNIQRFQKKDHGDVFLALPDNGAVTVYCDGEKAELF